MNIKPKRRKTDFGFRFCPACGNRFNCCGGHSCDIEFEDTPRFKKAIDLLNNGPTDVHRRLGKKVLDIALECYR